MLTSETVNYLVWKYLMEEGLQLAAAALDRETKASNFDTGNAPSGELVRLLLRGQQLEDIAREITALQAQGGRLQAAEQPDSVSKGVRATWQAAGGIASTIFHRDFATSDTHTLHLAVATIDRGVMVYDKNHKEYSLNSGKDSPTCVATPFSPHNREVIVVGHASGSVRVWQAQNADSPVLLGVLAPESQISAVVMVSPSPSGRYVCSVDTRGTARLWELESRTMAAEFSAENPILNVIWTSSGPGGDEAAVISSLSGIHLVSAASQSPVSTKQSCAASVHPLTKAIASGDKSGCLSLVNEGVAWSAHAGQVTALRFSESCRLVSVGFDGAVSEWDVQQRPPVLVNRVELGEPLLGLEVFGPRVAVFGPQRVYVLENLKVVGEVAVANVQSIALGEELVVTTRETTQVYE